MTDPTAPARSGARQRINALPHELEPGDVIRDYGVERTVTGIQASDNAVLDVVSILLDDHPDHAHLPDQLSVTATQPVTAWRMG
jgi:hypothetical protein